MERGIEVRENGAKIIQVCGNSGVWYRVIKPTGEPSVKAPWTRISDARKDADSY